MALTLREALRGQKVSDDVIKIVEDYGVSSVDDFLHLDDQDFSHLKSQSLKGFQERQLRHAQKNLQDEQQLTAMEEQCRKELRHRGLSDATLVAMATKGVVSMENVRTMTSEDVLALPLEAQSAAVQRNTLEHVIRDLNRPSVAEAGGIHVRGGSMTLGSAGDGAHMVLVQAGAREGGIKVEDHHMKADQMGARTRMVAVDGTTAQQQNAEAPENDQGK